jgi:1A family penicillin-binding protein
MNFSWTDFISKIIGNILKRMFLFLQSVGRATYHLFFFILWFLINIPLFIGRKTCRLGSFLKRLVSTALIKIKNPSAPRIKLCIPKNKLTKIKLPNIKIPAIKTPQIQPQLPFKLPSKKIKAPSFKLLFFIFCLISASLFYFFILKDLPSPQKLSSRDQIVSTKIYDRNGKLLYKVYDGNHNRSLVKLADIPQYVVDATIAIEDHNFYNHPGFSPKAIARAAWNNSQGAPIQGGSTITQQLVKNAFLTPQRSIIRKVKEVVLSIQVEVLYNKKEILEMYFNEVPYGGTAYGIEEAAQTYFNKSVKEINLAEAALLAGLPAAPTRFSPFGANPQLAIVRQRQVLNKMAAQGFISTQELEQARNQPIKLASQRTNIKAPHFVMYVKDQLVQKYGQRAVEQGGLKVITSLDLDLQQQAQKIVAEEIRQLQGMNVSNGAALVTKPQTGEILAMVGSKDYFATDIDGNVNLTTSERQPGSSIKPVNYSLALENGYTPATRIADTPITYHPPGAEPYSPVNYDRRFHGRVSLRTALGSSYNVPAVKLLSVHGVDAMIDQGQEMGITTWDTPQRYGLSLTLGGAEVKMTDMAVVYNTLANQGRKTLLNPVLEVSDYQGNILEKLNQEQLETKQVLDPGVAYLISNILADNQARIPAFGPNSYLHFPEHQVAVKTGTTNDKRDNWTIGYTTDHSVVVWVGNNDNASMSAVASGITGASPIWNKISKKLLEDQPIHKFPIPENVIQVDVCSYNGLLPCKGCPTTSEYFLKGTEPQYHCNTQKVKEDIKKSQILEGATTQR